MSDYKSDKSTQKKKHFWAVEVKKWQSSILCKFVTYRIVSNKTANTRSIYTQIKGCLFCPECSGDYMNNLIWLKLKTGNAKAAQ